MTSQELKQKWSGLSENTVTSGYRSLRISSACICELYLGVSSESKRCLILALPQGMKLDFKGIQKENLSIEYFREKNFIVLQLIDNDYHDLFDDLILSLYQGIKSIRPADEYSRFFIEAFYRWSEFFEDKKSDLLSEEAIKGLMGELLVLKSLIEEPGTATISYILNSWKGPYDKANDFELENKNLEVKAKTPSAREVKISSEFQLEIISGKGLELIVVSLISDFTVGISIRELISEIKQLVQVRSGDNSILWKALSQKDITPRNVKQYDKFRFKPVSSVTYDCSLVDFPKLTRSNVPVEINTLKYNLSTNFLTPFIIAQRDF